ncbi:hypothetical protein NC651_030999 [Populus alba x Populus x berolinensis]|nr:hypothetical protein NC651_030999 [Populus alba x Populus x berolinensis]
MAIDSYIAVHVPLRDYQLAITKTVLFTNTVVALPTGLGKTLTPAVVIYNYFRWFPNEYVKIYVLRFPVAGHTSATENISIDCDSRIESDPDVIPYVDDRKIELIELSPPDLLNSRDKFRRPPPLDLPLNRYGEIEACFGGLITPHHIRKLLSSHGIRLAYEMLEEKRKQWYLLET